MLLLHRISDMYSMIAYTHNDWIKSK
jgi:hypothetical protein